MPGYSVIRWFCDGAIMNKIRQVGRFLAQTRGTEIAEAALVLPIMFMLLLGIYYFGLALSTYETINHAAMEAARVAAVDICATCNISFSNTAAAGNAVKQALEAAGLNPRDTVQIPPASETVTACANKTTQCFDPGGPSMCVYYNVRLNTAGPPSCGVYVSFQYPYQFYLPFTPLNMQQLHLKARVQYAGEY
jgi:hypothetical protein